MACKECCRRDDSRFCPARKLGPLPIAVEHKVIAKCIEPLIGLSAIQKGLGNDKSPACTRRRPILGQLRR